MFRQHDIQFLGLCILQSLVLVLITACSQKPAIEPTATPEPRVAISNLELERYRQKPNQWANDSLVTVTPAVENPPSLMEPTSVTEDESDIDINPCGLLLPLTQPHTSRVDVLNRPEIPNGLVPEDATPALERIFEAPDTVGLAAFEIGRESEGIYLNAESPMPLASVVKIVNLIAYANAVADGELDPASWILLSDIEKYYLPGTDLGAHNKSLRGLKDRGLIARDPQATPLEEIPGMMIQYSSNAASDFIHLAIGQEKIELTIMDLGLTSHTAPCPWIGQFLIMNKHDSKESNRSAVTALINDPSAYGREVMHLTRAYVYDPAFRDDKLNSRFHSSGLDVQALFADNLNAQASAGDYARLMSRILQNGLNTSYANILVRRALEWPMQFPANQNLFSTIGYKNGMLPGVLTTVYYAQRLEDGTSVVVALFFRNLPLHTYRQWRQSLPHDALAFWLLSDPDAVPALRDLIG